jgi:RsiW-degrading membrane proteinase PrsW (M82 family)
MMGRALLVVGAMSTLGFIASAVLGYSLAGSTDTDMPLHVLVGLAASLLLLFSHCWIMFYLIGTGKAIKDAVNENALEPALIEETKRFKNASYPWLMLAMGLAMATFILGGGVATGSVPSWVHHVLFIITVPVQGWTLLIEKRVLEDNERLMGNLDRRLAAPTGRPAGA